MVANLIRTSLIYWFYRWVVHKVIFYYLLIYCVTYLGRYQFGLSVMSLQTILTSISAYSCIAARTNTRESFWIPISKRSCHNLGFSPFIDDQQRPFLSIKVQNFVHRKKVGNLSQSNMTLPWEGRTKYPTSQGLWRV